MKLKFDKQDILTLKSYIFDNRNRIVCDTCLCGNIDGYCPCYTCATLDKLWSYADKQWLFSMKKIGSQCAYHNIDYHDFVVEVLEDIIKRYPVNKRKFKGEIV